MYLPGNGRENTQQKEYMKLDVHHWSAKKNITTRVVVRFVEVQAKSWQDARWAFFRFRDRKKFKGGMQDCKRSAGGGKLVIFVVGRVNFGLK